jgi:hypothetical protein
MLQEKEFILLRYGRLQGHCSPKGYRTNKYFESIEITNTDLHYNKTYNFVYNVEEQTKLLSEGKPCYYTDKRFEEGYRYNFYKSCYLKWTRYKRNITLKSAIRLVNNVKGLPEGTIIKFDTGTYLKGKNFSLSYLYKTKKEIPINIEYQITKEGFYKQFDTCKYSQELTNLLREKGFLVQVFENNPNKLIDECDGQIAIAYGHGLRVGISSERNEFYGYSNGCNNVLFELEEDFNKWSQCQEISKDLSPKEVVELLINYKQ